MDPEPLHRKRAFYLLQKALIEPELNSPPWSLFLLLYDVLEEHAIHLIEVRSEPNPDHVCDVLEEHATDLIVHFNAP